MPDKTKQPADREKPVYAPPDLIPLGQIARGQGACLTGPSNLIEVCIQGPANLSVTCLTGGANAGAGCTGGTSAP